MPFLVSMMREAEESAIAALGEPRFAAEFQVGRHLSRDAAVRLAIDEPDRITAAAPDDGPGGGLLSIREAEVARLLADGLSNKEIGGRLFISVHTVDSHVRSILNKLGVNSRAQVAARMPSSRQ